MNIDLKEKVMWIKSAILLLATVSSHVVAQQEQKNNEKVWPVLIGSDGSVKSGELPKVEVRYTDIGLKSTGEVWRYPRAVKQIVDGKDIVPVEFSLVASRMTGLFTWEVTQKPTLVVFRSGQMIRLRPATTEEQLETKTEEKNPAGLVILACFVFWGLGNVSTLIPRIGGFLTEVFAFVTPWSIVGVGIALALSIPMNTIFTSITITFVVAFAAFFAAVAALSHGDKKKYCVSSAVTGGLMMVVVLILML